MEKRTITIEYQKYSLEEIPEHLRSVAKAAREVSLGSYAPYSRFHVGAAILLADGDILTGSNQENAAFPSSLCAERTAAYHASAVKPGIPMKAIAIAAWTRIGHPSDARPEECWQKAPISPCGACRQALLEYETLHGDMEVLLLGADTAYLFPSVKSLLPFSFTEF
ncbi:MAG: cytidine deaminase [Bacteroides sp.]|nr:cytidine deaminase [Bacteroides sp.]